MLTLDKQGVVREARVKVQLVPQIAHGPLQNVHAIVVHQTDSPTASGTIAGWRTGNRPDGAHFLIDKDGTTYQCVSLQQKCWHVGKIVSRCLLEKSCSKTESAWYDTATKRLRGHFSTLVQETHQHEKDKDYPDRYPVNEDSIGIEMVGNHIDDKTFETPAAEQQASLRWLVQELEATLHLLNTDVYRHSLISHKNPGEAAGAQW
ncbi:peptidoglycan recognition protein family protein [Terriglobus albidus]|nr:peptidoglycan recognition family protein [Terriglobus albidus]